MTYFGPIGEEDGDCSVLLDYFAKLGSHLKPNQNPAEFILEVTGAGIPKAAKQIKEQPKDDDDGDNNDDHDHETQKPAAVGGDSDEYVAAYQNSEFCKNALQQLEEGIYPIQRERETKGRLRRRWKKVHIRHTPHTPHTHRTHTHTHARTHTHKELLTIVVGSRSRRE
jgi:hypothetical protein